MTIMVAHDNKDMGGQMTHTVVILLFLLKNAKVESQP